MVLVLVVIVIRSWSASSLKLNCLQTDDKERFLLLSDIDSRVIYLNTSGDVELNFVPVAFI